jgi:hypothetical protein
LAHSRVDRIKWPHWSHWSMKSPKGGTKTRLRRYEYVVFLVLYRNDGVVRLRRRVRHTFRLGGVGFSWGYLGGGGAEWTLTPAETAPSDKKEGNMSCDAVYPSKVL